MSVNCETQILYNEIIIYKHLFPDDKVMSSIMGQLESSKNLPSAHLLLMSNNVNAVQYQSLFISVQHKYTPYPVTSLHYFQHQTPYFCILYCLFLHVDVCLGWSSSPSIQFNNVCMFCNAALATESIQTLETRRSCFLQIVAVTKDRTGFKLAMLFPNVHWFTFSLWRFYSLP